MTELPSEATFLGGKSDPTELKGRTFSRTGIKDRGDTSQWTDTYVFLILPFFHHHNTYR
jgi:hypothetical protein